MDLGFPEKTVAGLISMEIIRTITHKDVNGIEKVGLIVRRSESGNEWAEKNTPDDLFITKFPQGKAEVWIVQGDPKVYYSQADIPKPDSTNNCTELHSAEFNKKYYYEGELGAIYSPVKKPLLGCGLPLPKRLSS